MLIQTRHFAAGAVRRSGPREMPVPSGPKRLALHLIAWSLWVFPVAGLITLAPGVLRAQAAAEYGGAISKSGITALPAPKVVPSDSGKTANLAHLAARNGESSEAVNRRALENHAGKDAAKLMLRSVPSKAQVRIDGKVVGKTPLLLIVAPGQYNVQLDGERMSSAEKRVDVLPRETREVVLPLESRYPAHVQLR